MDNTRCIILSAVLACLLIDGTWSQGNRQPQCEQGSCYPATGDLLIGRERNLTASTTCGLDSPQRYCVVSHLEDPKKCFICDSRRPYESGLNERSHRIENIVSSFRDTKHRWWQAEAGNEKVYIQLDLEAEFHFTHMIMTFKTFRPKSMLIERSDNFGQTWKVYRYFAENCNVSFPYVTKRVVTSLSDVICDERYSSKIPSSEGEVIFKVLPPSVLLPSSDPYSEDVQDLLKLTNLRINFTELHTLGDTLLDKRNEINEKYYYSLYDITVRGSCSCYGHASRCLPVDGYVRDERTSRNMVHGKCECTHNTKGLNCEKCEDFYQDHPWRPARPNQPNVCKRCNCNNHAAQCHFDAARYEASGSVSGGVCDNCMHNTVGTNCQDCKEYYFQDPQRDIRDPEICQPCDCDPLGSLREGKCEQITDEIAATVAGRCVCKPFVEGARCDRCKPNYYNLRKDNPRGCEPCTCNPDGTVPDYGCNQQTGKCLCKRNVINDNCDACRPGYYGLSPDNRDGCNNCDCDLGGAKGANCNVTTGQCDCRPHIGGLRCTKVDPGYFYAHLDFYRFEAEHGRGKGNARVYVRAPVPGYQSYWTGEGYMQVRAGDSIEIPVSGLPYNNFYDIIIRYDARAPDVFEDVRVTVIRPGPINENTICAAMNPRDDLKTVSLQPDTFALKVEPPSCFEKNKTYTIRIDFNSYNKDPQAASSTVLVDSIVLKLNNEFIPIYQGVKYGLDEFLYARCDTQQMLAARRGTNEMCEKHFFSISAVMHDGALACDCDRTGSTSVECNPSGGQCPCKDNVVGRRCDQCTPGTYGLGPNGCLACNCHAQGATDNFCNEQTGQCTCNRNIDGRECNKCRYGYWGFPNCRPCNCNGNAEACDNLTGACFDCYNNTAGDYCERCEDGYYGDPRVGARIPCKPCMCPGGPGSPVQHADTCRHNPRNVEVYCDCKPGYTGRNCDTCISNYYGSPSIPGGQCEPCVCNNNINFDDPGSCEADTGECLKCLYNTEGFACEHCKAGYFGDATTQSCQRCTCSSIGTDPNGGECDRVTGQCPCLPNVVGKNCDQCAPNHWNITSGQGCSHCDCDPTGSESLQCNQLDGRCTCIAGRGGSKCADCQDLYYGDPHIQCLPCDCDSQGSAARQCERRTGQCKCVRGVTGFKCDRCARGTTGNLPNCVPCGECFDNWDKVIMELRDQTDDIIQRANDVSVTGAIKAFDEEFRQMQNNMDEIKDILGGVNITQVDIHDITQKMDLIRATLTNHTHHLNKVDEELRNSSTRVKRGDLRVDLLKDNVAQLKALAKQLRDNATDIQIQEARGAFEKVLEAERDSRNAQNKVDGSKYYITESEKMRDQTEQLVSAREQRFQDQLQENSDALSDLESRVDKLDDSMADINGMVCGEAESHCSALCGGGGCGQCGGASCNGAATRAQSALDMARQAEEKLNAKTMNATNRLEPQIESARQDAYEAHTDAKMAHEDASSVRNQTEDTKTNLKDLMNKIRDFLIGNNTASPDDVQKVVDEVMAMKIPLQANEIKDMADKISKALASLTDIDKILNETAEKRKIAEELKMQAKDASDDAQDIRKTAQNVRFDLNSTKQVQERAEEAIEEARRNIQGAQDDLTMITNGTSAVHEMTSSSQAILDRLQKRLDDLTKRYTALKVSTLDKAEKTADEAEDWADKAYKKALELNSTYSETSQELDMKHGDLERARDMSQKLKTRADDIFKKTQTQLNVLRDIESKLGGDETRLGKLSDEIDKLNMQMDGYLSYIREKAKYYDSC